LPPFLQDITPKNIINVPKVVGNLVVQFRNSQKRLPLYTLPAESQTHKLCRAGQELTIAFARE
jgi:hypothetical protein